MIRVTDFLEHLKKVKPSAAELYYYQFRNYARWLDMQLESLTIDDLSFENVSYYLQTLNSPYTYNAFLAACRSFAKYVRFSWRPRTLDEQFIKYDFYDAIYSIPYKSIPESVKSAITVDQLATLLEATKSKPLLYSATVVHFYTGARPVELARPFRFGTIDLNAKKLPKCVVDLRQSVMTIETAKREDAVRLIPIDGIERHVKVWFRNIDVVTRFCRPRMWYSVQIQPYAEELGFKVTAKTARRTFDTEMTMRGVEEWEIKYWMGHKGSITDEYRDFTKLVSKLRDDIVERHYIFEVV